MAEISKPGCDIGIQVSDLEGQMRFYGEALGLAHVGHIDVPGANLHFYACGHTLLKLYGIPGLARTPRSAEPRSGVSYFTIHVADLAKTVADLERHGATILQPITEFDAGVTLPAPIGRVKARFAMVADADGNKIELMEKA